MTKNWLEDVSFNKRRMKEESFMRFKVELNFSFLIYTFD